MGEHLGVVLAPAELLDPAGGEEVLLGAVGARDLAVRDVADEQMAERVLAVARDRAARARGGRTPCARARAAPSSSARRPASEASAPVQKRFPITAASWSSAFCSGSSRSSRAAISPWTVSGSSPDLAAVAQHARELLGVERVAAGAGEQLGLRLRRKNGAEQLARAGARCPRRRAPRARRQRVRLAAAPVGPPGEQLGPGGADDEQRHPGRPVDQVVDEVEQVVVGPVQVLEDQHQRPLLGELLEEAPPRGEGLVPHVAAALGAAGEPDERPQVRLAPTGRRPRTPSFRSGSAASSPSRIPSCALTISPSAQKVMPSPYGRHRPCRHEISSGRRSIAS